MNEVLFKKIKYLLSFKFNSNDDEKYLLLLEKLIYDFLISMEKTYNVEGPNAYYSFLLNKLNYNIKSIIAPSDTFYYHPLGFLELNTNLTGFLKNYSAVDVSITKELKEEILRKNYFFQFLTVIKSGKDHNGLIALSLTSKDSFGIPIGTDLLDGSYYSALEESLTEAEAIELAGLTKIYKKRYRVIYPDGTSYKYFMYFRSLDSKNPESSNMVKILEEILGKKKVMQNILDDSLDIIDQFNVKYDDLLGELRFDPNSKKRSYTWWKLIAEYLYFINTEKTGYRKLEYIKNLNEKLFLIYENKLANEFTDDASEEKIKSWKITLKILEENMLYNEDLRLHLQLEHVKILKRMKNFLERKDEEKINQSSRNLKLYKIYSRSKKSEKEVFSSVQPIVLDMYCVTIRTKKIDQWNKKLLVCGDFSVYDNETLREIEYKNIYFCVESEKLLYSSTDLEVPTRESEIIRKCIAERISTLSIMEIVIKERGRLLGDFVYSPETEQCIVYKNDPVVKYLMREGDLYV